MVRMPNEALKRRGVREARQDKIVLHTLLYNKHPQTFAYTKSSSTTETILGKRVKDGRRSCDACERLSRVEEYCSQACIVDYVSERLEQTFCS